MTTTNRPAKKFQLQDPDEPTRTCKTSVDTDRSTCCGACIMWFEVDWNDLLGYSGDAFGCDSQPTIR